MYAVIQAGGKQYRVEVGARLRLEKIEGSVGDTVTLGEVLLVGGNAPLIGKPLVPNASVEARIVEQGRAKKIKIYKKKRRKGYERTRGHRQPFTCIEIAKINA
ncbi:MAG: 50S ribosomal protein L21 [Deltaproteobacteria bacterium RBG_13_65_10]|nr:MAG: 50S ribosomal protein L21 [Deltaproteobacteria bacterium RBG_13_65_10]